MLSLTTDGVIVLSMAKSSIERFAAGLYVCLLGGYGELTAAQETREHCATNGPNHNAVVGIRILKEDLLDLP